MKKKEARQNTDVKDYELRLKEIAETALGSLSDDQVLALLAERKEITNLVEEEKRAHQEEQTRLLTLENERVETEAKLRELNQSITPDKDDDTLLALIGERRMLEQALERITKESEMPHVIATEPPKVSVESTLSITEMPDRTEPAIKEFAPDQKKETVPDVVPTETSRQQEQVPEMKAEHLSEITSVKHFGEQQIAVNRLEESGEMQEYFEQLRGNAESLGILLQGMPVTVRSNRAFMLKVAEIDPAYAMHYAGDALKHDEYFNIQVAGMTNRRNSGNALSEMLPEARTAPVVLAGVKQDFRNIRFALPNMENYREMLAIAKKSALERVKALKESVDVTLLIPKVLQKDKAFMAEVEQIVAPRKEAMIEETPSVPKTKKDMLQSEKNTPVSSSEERSVWRIHHSDL